MTKFRSVLLTVFVLLVSLAFAGKAQGVRNSEVGTVYTTTNAATGNAILAFDELRDGSLKFQGSFPTQGLGSGGGLGNQGALALSPDKEWLLSVNAGSNEISVFEVEDNQLQLVDKVSSNGTRPVSLTVQQNSVYVVNAGSDNVAGFRLSRDGHLRSLPNSNRFLSATGTAAAQIRLSPDGRFLVVTEKNTNAIDTFPVNPNGSLDNPVINRSAGATPFGFAFDRRGRLFVSNAAGGAANGSSLSSYQITRSAGLRAITPIANTNQTAACWVVLTRDGQFAYVSNTASGTITGFRVDPNGSLSLLEPTGLTATIGATSGPTDMALSRNRFLQVLAPGNGAIATFQVLANGGLATLSTVDGIPSTATGMAVLSDTE